MAARPKNLNHSDEELALMPPEYMTFDEREYVASKPNQYWVDVIARTERRDERIIRVETTHVLTPCEAIEAPVSDEGGRG